MSGEWAKEAVAQLGKEEVGQGNESVHSDGKDGE
jgi:hypothetical protein